MSFLTSEFLEAGKSASEILGEWDRLLRLRQNLLNKQAAWEKELDQLLNRELNCDLVGNDEDRLKKVFLLDTGVRLFVPRQLQQVEDRFVVVRSEAASILPRERARLGEMYNRSVMPQIYAEAEKLVAVLGGNLSGEKKLELAKSRAAEILLARGDIPTFPIIHRTDGPQGPIAELRTIIQLQADFEGQLR